LGSEWGRLLDRFFEEPWSLWDRSLAASGGWVPSLDVVDGEKEIAVTVELPGVDPKDFEISVLGQTLVVTGQKKSEKEEKGKTFYRSERSYGSFRREIGLPEGTDPEKVNAEYANGVLTIRIEKQKAATPKRIAVATK
jgi:HSP20 family protein